MPDVGQSETSEPHVNVWGFGTCPACGSGEWHIIAVPQIATELQFPQFGVCSECEHQIDMRNDPPFQVVDPPLRGQSA
jgi:hypothetical protein